MKVLLVFELLPEEVQYAVIPEVGTADLALLDLVNGTTVNIDDLTDEEHRAHDEINNYLGKAGMWYNFITAKDSLPQLGPYDRVYVAGFYL